MNHKIIALSVILALFAFPTFQSFATTPHTVNGTWIDQAKVLAQNSTETLVSASGYIFGSIVGHYTGITLIFNTNDSWVGVIYCTCSVNKQPTVTLIATGDGNSLNINGTIFENASSIIIAPSPYSGVLSTPGIFVSSSGIEFGSYNGTVSY